MPKEGFRLNVVTGKWVEVFDHAQWISGPENAATIGLSPALAPLVKSMDWQTDRTKILVISMESGLVRVRGHGDSVSVEFTYPAIQVLPVLEDFLVQTFMAGPMTVIFLRNLKTREFLDVRFRDLPLKGKER